MKGNNGILIGECAQCGKAFAYDPLFYVYHRHFRMIGEKRGKKHIFCGWNCLCAAQRASDEHFGAIREEKRKDAYERRRQRIYDRYHSMTPDERAAYLENNKKYYANRTLKQKLKKAEYDRKRYEKKKGVWK